MRTPVAIVACTLAALALQALPDDAAAQQTRRGMGGGPPPESQMRLFGAAGWAEVDVDGLNARLASLPEPYSPLNDDMVVLGGGLHARINRLIAGGEGAVLVSLDEAQVGDARSATFSGFYGALTVGFSVIQTDGLDIYPLVQLGGASASLEVKERGDPTWDELLGDPGRSSMLSTFNVYGAGGLAMEYAFRGGFFAGVRGTWAWTPDSDDWTSDEGDVLGGPDIGLSGPNLRLMIGFGGRGGR